MRSRHLSVEEKEISPNIVNWKIVINNPSNTITQSNINSGVKITKSFCLIK